MVAATWHKSGESVGTMRSLLGETTADLSDMQQEELDPQRPHARVSRRTSLSRNYKRPSSTFFSLAFSVVLSHSFLNTLVELRMYTFGLRHEHPSLVE